MSQNKIIGNYVDITNIQYGEHLQLSFQPGSIPLKQRWRNNGLSADFLSDYVSTFFPMKEDDAQGLSRLKEIKHAVSYIANELLENGMKYTDCSLEMPMKIHMLLENDAIIFNETNSVSPTQAQNFLNFITQLNKNDPMTLFMEQLEKQAMDEAGSGLGFLTMINDYQAELSWQFVEDKKNDMTTITTAVRLPI